jgi:hypothetical protein
LRYLFAALPHHFGFDGMAIAFQFFDPCCQPKALEVFE